MKTLKEKVIDYHYTYSHPHVYDFVKNNLKRYKDDLSDLFDGNQDLYISIINNTKNEFLVDEIKKNQKKFKIDILSFLIGCILSIIISILIISFI